MSNPESVANYLNFSNLFKKARIHNPENRDLGILSKSQYVSPRHNISHRTPKFIPRCPYGRSVSVNSSRKPEVQPRHDPEEQPMPSGIFSVRSFQIKNQPQRILSGVKPGSSHSNSRGRRTQDNSMKLYKPDKFQVLRLQPSPTPVAQDRRAKIRGLKVRTGSQVKKKEIKLELDHNVVLMGVKLIK